LAGFFKKLRAVVRAAVSSRRCQFKSFAFHYRAGNLWVPVESKANTRCAGDNNEHQK
jgi:hypothetical protein